ncbi:Rcs stress response system protein RcsF [Photorhabdus asymbiotica]|uniref:Outer membrane lipoprotein RcsF n=2 Tax=Photorhabdus asymbiotica TaxID=291112 RepID=C7BLB2_PHOAA|nr:Rcs stress response system protein RcsF [Photorhabdus asymbiotica]CAQ82758.1 exopolysaccharide synthesis regulatory protein rcsf [Photorhabdus asymbiotica]
MRWLLVPLLVLFIAGCSMQQTTFTDSSQLSDMRLKKLPTEEKGNLSSSVKLYTKSEELLGTPFKDLGIVSGQSCRNSLQDPPANITIARNQMIMKATYLNANAVLLHQCEMLSGQGCYQIAICEGSALLITQ